jgi:hypothetical protein
MIKKVVGVLSETKHCFPKCKSFRCSKNAIELRGDIVWCRWLDENCNAANCTFATCVKRKLLPNGICGETVKRKTTETLPEEEVHPLRLRRKALRRIDEREFF